jgi:AcrR family transcriptional regulator
MREELPDIKTSPSTRDRLLAAALQQLVACGYRGATSRKIAQAAGVNEITLFRHFASKDELIRTALIEKSREKSMRLPEPTGVLEEDLHLFAEELVRAITEESAFILRLIPELSQFPPPLQSVVTQAANDFTNTMASFFHYYQQEGILNAECGVDIATMFLGPIFTHYFLGALRADTSAFDTQRYVRRFLEGYLIHE